jgi:hypothetical protein
MKQSQIGRVSPPTPTVPSRQRIIRFGILIKGMRAAIMEFGEKEIGSKEEGKKKWGAGELERRNKSGRGYMSFEGHTGILFIPPQWAPGMTSDIVPY